MVGVLIIILKKTLQQKCQYLKKELSRKKSICDVSAQASSIVYTLDCSNSTQPPYHSKVKSEAQCMLQNLKISSMIFNSRTIHVQNADFELCCLTMHTL